MEPNTTQILTPATTMPCTLAELKVQLRMPSTEGAEDDLLTQLIEVATEWAQDYTGRVFIDSPMLSTAPYFYNTGVNSLASGSIKLERGPVSAITKIEYYAEDSETLTEIHADNYRLENSSLTAHIYFDEDYDTPEVDARHDAVQITYQSGYADAAAVPKRIKQAILMKAARLYTHPDDGVNERATISESLLAHFCTPRL